MVMTKLKIVLTGTIFNIHESIVKAILILPFRAIQLKSFFGFGKNFTSSILKR